MRATGNGLDRAAAGALRGRAAARAARQAMREGGTPRAAGRAARAALKDAHRDVKKHGAWRRLAGSLLWGAAGWTYGQLHAWNRSLTAALASLFTLRRGQPENDRGQNRARIGTTVDRPANPAAGRHNGGADMSGKGGGVPQWVHLAEELGEALRRYEPPPGPRAMVQVYSDMGYFPDAMEAIAKGLAVLSDRCRTEWPLDPAISEIVATLAKVQVRIASVSAEIKPAIERMHGDDLDRHRAPRPQERMWDVG